MKRFQSCWGLKLSVACTKTVLAVLQVVSTFSKSSLAFGGGHLLSKVCLTLLHPSITFSITNLIYLLTITFFCPSLGT